MTTPAPSMPRCTSRSTVFINPNDSRFSGLPQWPQSSVKRRSISYISHFLCPGPRRRVLPHSRIRSSSQIVLSVVVTAALFFAAFASRRGLVERQAGVASIRATHGEECARRRVGDPCRRQFLPQAVSPAAYRCVALRGDSASTRLETRKKQKQVEIGHAIFANTIELCSHVGSGVAAHGLAPCPPAVRS
jgi:hypothetical protein